MSLFRYMKNKSVSLYRDSPGLVSIGLLFVTIRFNQCIFTFLYDAIVNSKAILLAGFYICLLPSVLLVSTSFVKEIKQVKIEEDLGFGKTLFCMIMICAPLFWVILFMQDMLNIC